MAFVAAGHRCRLGEFEGSGPHGPRIVQRVTVVVPGHVQYAGTVNRDADGVVSVAHVTPCAA